MPKSSPTWGTALRLRLDELGYRSSKNLADAVGRKPPTVQRWKGGEIPPAALWESIDAFFGQPGWTEAVTQLSAEMDALEKLGPSEELDAAGDLLDSYISITREALPLPATDRARLKAVEQELKQQQGTLAELQDLVDSLVDRLRETLDR